MEIKFPKLYRYDRLREHCCVAIPFAKGELTDAGLLQIYQDGRLMPSQKKVTSRHSDGSIRYLFVRFLADLPGNAKAVLEAKKISAPEPDGAEINALQVEKKGQSICVKGALEFSVSDDGTTIFDYLKDGRKTYTAKQFVGPLLVDGAGISYGVKLGQWRIEEAGPLVAVLRCMGSCEEGMPSFELKITAYAEKPWVEISYRIINSTENPLHVASLVFALLADENAEYDPSLKIVEEEVRGDSVGEGSAAVKSFSEYDSVFYTTGIKELPKIEALIGQNGVRTCVGSSNYKTNFIIGRDGNAVNKIVDDAYLVGEANEHFAEVFYGTFFADRTEPEGGVCATIFQAQQNYPKAVKADQSGIYVMLVPRDVNKVVMEPGMSREQRFLLHFHDAGESLTEIDNRSLIYQMPDKSSIPPEVFRDAGVMPDIFVDRDKINDDVEISLIGKCDGHARCYGMLNWGDAPDPGYTTQGRGKGMLVWGNNEYDYPHACALFYARTGERRFLDYMITAASHWMDVDVCHYSKDPLLLGGQWEHTRGHCKDGVMVCSHEWVEGLLDCYHFTGDERALETALGIGENVLRLLETPAYQTRGESNARETGWALRTLVALYVETYDEKWLGKCSFILDNFKQWTEEYGEWVAPYTDNTTIRVGFMISVAVGSMMRYYRVFPDEEIKKLMLSAVDDLVDNCLMDNGLFYYKELPSLNRLGQNTLLLEALTIGYELTGDAKYLTYGKRTFWKNINAPAPSVAGVKSIVEDAVVAKTTGMKNFAQCFIPLSVYYKALTDNGMI
ncbi:MAG: glycoside hydrolase family 127 protein [Lachnoclostridium sp.]|nr:glycoside hydrolase family 127 protein [Lachnospira sp.]MCM1248821.1 glycoside hydrolase family 127 protein [Lachnoclostridium sp.]